MNEKKFTLTEHLAELRKRLFIILIVIIGSSSICFLYVDRAIQDILKPASQLEFVYLSPPELFLAYVKISLVAGLIISSPITFYQIWLFIKPGLEKSEKRIMLISLFAGVFFFIVGTTFAYKIILPITIQFFANIKVEDIEPMISFGSYIGFISSILLSFGLVFEMPMLVALLTRFKLISAPTLRKNRKIVILLVFIVAAILTPPDVISQMLLAGPMLLLFEFSILISSILGKEKKEENILKRIPSSSN
ncbi:twin-arginine translocase subunit TatC [Anaerosolibacter sp.]|uniref:twin-arginine translocase subunit TatC n=1 Tax=Anaerosolibacter sp. TaxID=1872527 RepID=UPI0039EEE895